MACAWHLLINQYISMLWAPVAVRTASNSELVVKANPFKSARRMNLDRSPKASLVGLIGARSETIRSLLKLTAHTGIRPTGSWSKRRLASTATHISDASITKMATNQLGDNWMRYDMLWSEYRYTNAVARGRVFIQMTCEFPDLIIIMINENECTYCKTRNVGGYYIFENITIWLRFNLAISLKESGWGPYFFQLVNTNFGEIYYFANFAK